MGKGKSDDPAWSRSSVSNSAKKKKMCSRSSMRMLRSLMKKKRAVDKTKERTTCVTRTVEMSSTQSIGKERSKLLFMLALGLLPNSDAVDKNSPLVKLDRLDPEVEAEAKEKTRLAVFRIFQERNSHSQIRKKVEVVDLVSSGDESDDEPNPITTQDMYRSSNFAHARRGQLSRSSANFVSPPPPRIIYSSQPQPRKPVFKPLGNDQNNSIFRNFKPEQLTRIMNPDKLDDKSKPRGIFSQTGALVSSLKSYQILNSNSSNNIAPKISQATNFKSQLNGIREDKRTPTLEPEYILPDALITID